MNGYNDPPYYISAYGLAKKRGFTGSLDDWLNSLIGPEGPQGKTAYEYAVDGGFVGTEAEFAAKMAKEAATISNAENMNKHMMNIKNPHNVSAQQVGALPMAGGDMQGPIAMGGHRVRGLGEPVENGDAVPLGYANSKFAPAGYGIGSSSKSIGDANNATVGGVYYYGSTASNIPDGFSNGVIFVQNRADAQIFQRITDIYGLAAERIRQSNGTWGDWEWLNPPMVPGVEYRTTERWNGNPVYTKAVECGALGNNTSDDITHPTENVVVAWVCGGYYQTEYGRYSLPYVASVDGNQVFASATEAIIHRVNKGMGTVAAMTVAIKYIKSTD